MEQKPSQEQIPTAVTGGVAIVLVALGFFFFLFHTTSPRPALLTSDVASSTIPSANTVTSSPLIHTTPGVETWYTNDTLHFSFRLPDGFMAPEAKTNVSGAQAVTVYNTSGDKLLVVAIPITVDIGNTLSAQDIIADTKGQVVTNIRPAIVGTVVTGLAFDTDSKEWGGEGSALWFKFNGYLYEVTTYAKDAPLLDFIRSTWQFSKPVPPPASHTVY